MQNGLFKTKMLMLKNNKVNASLNIDIRYFMTRQTISAEFIKFQKYVVQKNKKRKRLTTSEIDTCFLYD